MLITIKQKSDAEYAELEEATELGQTEIYSLPLYVSGLVANQRLRQAQIRWIPLSTWFGQGRYIR
jgi:hypothetical protein